MKGVTVSMTRDPLHPELKHLAQEIRTLFNDGFSMEPEAVAFIESTYDISENQLKEALLFGTAAVDDPDLLFDLIVYPDEPVQLRMELLIQAMGSPIPEVETVTDALIETPVHATILLPLKKEKIHVPVHRSALVRFIRRLNLSRLLHPLFQKVLKESSSLESSLKIAVKLRNSRFEMTEKKADALCRFLDHFPGDEPLFFKALDFLLEWFTEYKDSPDVEWALLEQKKSLAHHLHKADDLSACLTRTTMESFHLSGNRTFVVNETHTRQKIILIRAILFHVYKMGGAILEEAADDVIIEAFGPVRDQQEQDLTGSLF